MDGNGSGLAVSSDFQTQNNNKSFLDLGLDPSLVSILGLTKASGLGIGPNLNRFVT